MDSLPLHVKGGGRVVGLTYSDNALFGKDDLSAVPLGGGLWSFQRQEGGHEAP